MRYQPLIYELFLVGGYEGGLGTSQGIVVL